MSFTLSRIYRGRISVFFNEKFYVGPNWRFSLLLPGLTGVGTLLFACYTCEVLIWRLIVLILYVLSVVVYGITAFRDPGIVTGGVPLSKGSPRSPPRWVRVPNYTKNPPVSSTPIGIGREGLPLPLSFMNGAAAAGEAPPASPEYHMVEQRWCYTCNLYRPLRSVHCRFCDVCLYRRDHHCPWIGVCVAEKNYGFFYCMLWGIIVLEATTGILSAMQLSRRASVVAQCCACVKEDLPFSVMSSSSFPPFFSLSDCPNKVDCHCDVSPVLVAVTKTYGIELILTIVSFIVSLMVVGFMGDHTKQICRNELLGDDSRFGGTNVFDKGSCVRNIKASVCYRSDEAMIVYEVCQPPAQVERQDTKGEEWNREEQHERELDSPSNSLQEEERKEESESFPVEVMLSDQAAEVIMV